MNIVILGLSITSSWGNGHATIYRALVRELDRRGHRVLFLERDMPWYADNRDLPAPPFGKTMLYGDVATLRQQMEYTVREADMVVVGSYVPDGPEVIDWVQRTARGVTAFYDIDTPVTLAALQRGACEYLTPEQVPGFDLYLSFTGGPTLHRLEQAWGAKRARPLYCCVDPELYYPEPHTVRWDLAYMGTYSPDRQPRLERRLSDAARRWDGGRFAVVGPQYPERIDWPGNVERLDHLPPGEHRAFYNRQRFTLNITREDMVRAGWSPSVRLFEAAACGVPIITDRWPGLESFFEPGWEILVADRAEDTLEHLRGMSESERLAVGDRARRRVLGEHTAADRARQLEGYVAEVREGAPAPQARRPGARVAAAEQRWHVKK